MEGWADRRVSMVGGVGDGALPPRNWKKDDVRGNLTSHLCFTNEITGDRPTLHTYKLCPTPRK